MSSFEQDPEISALLRVGKKFSIGDVEEGTTPSRLAVSKGLPFEAEYRKMLKNYPEEVDFGSMKVIEGTILVGNLDGIDLHSGNEILRNSARVKTVEALRELLTRPSGHQLFRVELAEPQSEQEAA